MRKGFGFLFALVAVSVGAAWLSGQFTLLAVLGWALMLGALIGPMYLAPERYAEWTRRCRNFLRIHSSTEHGHER